jgi:mannose-6-phosphate isomerase-like protein (cupin superfamily)
VSGVQFAHIDELAGERWDNGLVWRPVRHHLGIGAFGAGTWHGDAGVELIEEHTEQVDNADEHEELYLVIRGCARFTVDGEEFDARAGTLVGVPDPAVSRKAVATEDDTAILAIGAPRGRAYEVSPWERRRLERGAAS